MSRSTLTLSLSPGTIMKAKILAAQRKTSLSRLFADYIKDLEAQDRAYQFARRRALTHLKHGFDLGARPTSREDLHARSRLR
jgi:hypothetical protein